MYLPVIVDQLLHSHVDSILTHDLGFLRLMALSPLTKDAALGFARERRGRHSARLHAQLTQRNQRRTDHRHEHGRLHHHRNNFSRLGRNVAHELALKARRCQYLTYNHLTVCIIDVLQLCGYKPCKLSVPQMFSLGTISGRGLHTVCQGVSLRFLYHRALNEMP